MAWKLSVNVAKSKIAISRKGGKIRNDEKWVFRNENLEIVNDFKCLKTEKHILVQARKTTFFLKKNVKNIQLLFLFDCFIGLILNYCSEIWGAQKGLNIERIS